MILSKNNPKEIINNSSYSNELKSIANKVFNGERITFDEGVLLYKEAELGFLGTLANYVREKKNGNYVYFTSFDRYIYCVDVRDGRIIWKQFMNGNSLSSPVVDDTKTGIHSTISGMSPY